MSGKVVYQLGEFEYVEAYVKECAGPNCTASIAMAKSKFDRWHAFDPATGASHFTTCPDKKDFRPSRRGKT